jgi:2-iminobutanoate/2-iminopropanoate deaminase
MEPITTPNAPAPAGHYAQAIAHDGFIFVAGQLPLDPSSGALIAPGDIVRQTEATLGNVAAILEAAGSGLDRVCSMTIYITDRELWPRVNETYARMLGAHRPARAVIPVPELREGCLIEIQAIAGVGNRESGIGNR